MHPGRQSLQSAMDLPPDGRARDRRAEFVRIRKRVGALQPGNGARTTSSLDRRIGSRRREAATLSTAAEAASRTRNGRENQARPVPDIDPNKTLETKIT